MSFQRTALPDSSGAPLSIRLCRQGALLLLCAFLLSSCSPGSTARDGTAAPEETPVIEPLISPPGSAARPLEPGESGTVFLPNGMPALQPLETNADELFARQIRDTDERFERLENAVTELRREFNAVTPAIVRLVAVEEDIQDLIGQLELLLRNEPPPAPAVASAEIAEAAAPLPAGTAEPVPLTPAPPQAPEPQTPVPVPIQARPPPAPPPAPPPTPPPVPQATAPPPSPPPAPSPAVPGVRAVEQLRIGEHSDKTRLVLDVSGKAAYSYDLDNEENLLVIELPDTGWRGQQSWAGKSPLLASYTVQPLNGQGSRLIIVLKHDAQVIKESAIPADRQNPYRIVLDLMSPQVHR